MVPGMRKLGLPTDMISQVCLLDPHDWLQAIFSGSCSALSKTEHLFMPYLTPQVLSVSVFCISISRVGTLHWSHFARQRAECTETAAIQSKRAAVVSSIWRAAFLVVCQFPLRCCSAPRCFFCLGCPYFKWIFIDGPAKTARCFVTCHSANLTLQPN